MTEEHQTWATNVLIDHNKDIFTKKIGFAPSRVDLKSINGELWSITGTNVDHSSLSRQQSTLKLFQEAFKKSTKPEFECVICCEDLPREFDKPAFFYSTSWETGETNFSNVIPDYVFNSPCLRGRYGFEGEGEDNFEKVVEEIKKAGNTVPATNKIGWIGNVKDNYHREQFYELYHNHPDIEIIPMSWYKDSPLFTGKKAPSVWPKNFLTYADQVKRWKYFVDIQGNGWTDRVKFFYFSKRLLFRINRPYNEFYDQYLIPWKHYVPVENNEDLFAKIEIIKNDPEIEEYIIQNAYDFAINNLTKDKAVEYIVNIINTINWQEAQEIHLSKRTEEDKDMDYYLPLYNFDIENSTKCKFEVISY